MRSCTPQSPYICSFALWLYAKISSLDSPLRIPISSICTSLTERDKSWKALKYFLRSASSIWPVYGSYKIAKNSNATSDLTDYKCLTRMLWFSNAFSYADESKIMGLRANHICNRRPSSRSRYFFSAAAFLCATNLF